MSKISLFSLKLYLLPSVLSHISSKEAGQEIVFTTRFAHSAQIIRFDSFHCINGSVSVCGIFSMENAKIENALFSSDK